MEPIFTPNLVMFILGIAFFLGFLVWISFYS